MINSKLISAIKIKVTMVDLLYTFRILCSFIILPPKTVLKQVMIENCTQFLSFQ